MSLESRTIDYIDSMVGPDPVAAGAYNDKRPAA